MSNLVLLGVLATLSVPPSIDSVFVGRRVMETPRHVTLRKESMLTTGDLFRAATESLQQSVYFDLASTSLADACGDPNANVNRWTFRVHADGAWHELTVRDDCAPSSEALSAQLEALRRLAGDVIAGHVRPASPPHR